MRTKSVVLLDEGQCQKLDALLVERIYEFNSKTTGYFDGKLFGASFQNEAGEVIAGFNGHTWGACAKISNLWVSEHHRGHGGNPSRLRASDPYHAQLSSPRVLRETRLRAKIHARGSAQGPFQHRLCKGARRQGRHVSLRSSTQPAADIPAGGSRLPLRTGLVRFECPAVTAPKGGASSERPK